MWQRVVSLMLLFLAGSLSARGQELNLQLRYQSPIGDHRFERRTKAERWNPEETAIVVCDVWDKHHCLNAVRRMEEFLPRMNELLTKSREMGVVIIHSPSDCMSAYDGLPPRLRAVNAPKASTLPKDAEFWCSGIPTEEHAEYPIDQSDGGEDDDPAEHAKWAAELKALGRNPGMPWKTQSPMIEIDNDRDYISDRGDEVWNILEAHNIKNVVLVGVHTNMCVLGRPFGLRQMARNGKHVVLMRDLTDCMYNPKRWPYVDHFTGNDLIVSHVERYVCPTVTSDQVLGGQQFVSKFDTRTTRDVMDASESQRNVVSHSVQANIHWKTVDFSVEHPWKPEEAAGIRDSGVVWLRCSVRLPSEWAQKKALALPNLSVKTTKAWLNGTPFHAPHSSGLEIAPEAVVLNDINLLVLRIDVADEWPIGPSSLVLQSGSGDLSLAGRWQFRVDDDSQHSNIPLPAKFGLGSDVLFEPVLK